MTTIQMDMAASGITTLENVNSVVVTRLYRLNNHVAQFGTEVIDAVLDKLANCENARSVVLSGGKFLPSSTTPFLVEKEIFARVRQFRTHSSTGEPEQIEVELFSEKLPVGGIKDWIDDVYEEYQKFINTQLGKKLFFFDMVAPKDEIPTRYDASGGFCIRQHPNNVLFEKKPFSTTRSFDNIFFPDKDRVLKRLEFFLEKRDWYLKRGVQHTLGFLFHGPPGTGKSSTLKAIANLTNRHIINVSLKNVHTKTQLKNLLFDPRIVVLKNPEDPNSKETLKISIERRLYVFEDFDAVEDGALSYLLERQTKNKKPSKKKMKKALVTKKRSVEKTPKPEDTPSAEKEVDDDELSDEDPEEVAAFEKKWYRGGKGADTENVFGDSMLRQSEKESNDTVPVLDDPNDAIDLTTFLNLLDGVLEADGRLMVFTTNFPDRLDKALLRQGRIDVEVKFALATRQTLKEMYESFFDGEVCPAEELEKFKPNKISPARITSLLFQHFDCPALALESIIKAR